MLKSIISALYLGMAGLAVVTAPAVAANPPTHSKTPAKPAAPPRPTRLSIVAGEAVYGTIAQRLAGSYADVTSLLTSPAQDPHHFEPSANQARAVANANIVIINGAGYDDWLDKLVAANNNPAQRVIKLDQLLHRTKGQNPHLWFNPRAISALAAALTVELDAAKPDRASYFDTQRDALNGALLPLLQKMGVMRDAHHDEAIAATEPVFDEMAQALGLKTRDASFALAIMNGSEPLPSEIAAFESDITHRDVKAVIYNQQTQNPAVAHMCDLARQNGLPVIGVTETMPANTNYETWMLGILTQLNEAL